MFRWCSYCQTLLGEQAPLTDFRISHGICRPCDRRLEAGEALIEQNEAVIRFYRQLFAAASVGDASTCAELAKQARAEGFAAVELLVGLLQPALERIGHRWEVGIVTVADEHRFTAWCEAMIGALELPTAPAGSLDLLIVQAPGNRHEIGPRIAEQVLLSRGLRALAVTDELSLEALLDLTGHRAPSWIGFSCALPRLADAAVERAAELVAQGYAGGILLSGQAIRRDPDSWSATSAICCLTIDDAVDVIERHRPGAESGFDQRGT